MQLLSKLALGLVGIILAFLIFSFSLSVFGALVSMANGAAAPAELGLGRLLGALFGDLVCIAVLQRVVRRYLRAGASSTQP
jgi:hypothetical protein